MEIKPQEIRPQGKRPLGCHFGERRCVRGSTASPQPQFCLSSPPPRRPESSRHWQHRRVQTPLSSPLPHPSFPVPSCPFPACPNPQGSPRSFLEEGPCVLQRENNLSLLEMTGTSSHWNYFWKNFSLCLLRVDSWGQIPGVAPIWKYKQHCQCTG